LEILKGGTPMVIPLPTALDVVVAAGILTSGELARTDIK
jgi:hypothetical protein